MYRIPLYLFVVDGQRQEVSLGGGASRQCFYDLTPSSQYELSIHTQMLEMEGPAVSITDMTSMFHIMYTLYFVLYIMYCIIVYHHMIHLFSPCVFPFCQLLPLKEPYRTTAALTHNPTFLIPPFFSLSQSFWEDRGCCCSSSVGWWAEVNSTAPGETRSLLTIRVIDRELVFVNTHAHAHICCLNIVSS